MKSGQNWKNYTFEVEENWNKNLVNNCLKLKLNKVDKIEKEIKSTNIASKNIDLGSKIEFEILQFLF